MIKLVVTDLDGTFLDEDKKISSQNKEAVERLKKNDVKFCICTGRIYASALMISEQVANFFPIISCNGAFIKDPSQNKVLQSFAIDTSIAIDIIKVLNDLDITYHFYNENTIFSNKMARNAKTFYEKFKDQSSKPINVIVAQDLHRHITSNTKINKFILFPGKHEVKQKVIDYLSSLKHIDITRSGEDNIEIMKQGVSKGTGVNFLKEKFGYSRDEIMVLGDQHNDLSMFLEADHSIAMGNAPTDVKEKAKFITKTNRESGFAAAVDHLIFGKGDKIVYR